MIAMQVVDASVYVAFANEADRFHEPAVRWLESCLDAQRPLAAPSLLVVEVAASIRRLTGDRRLAERVVSDLVETGWIELAPLTPERSRRAAKIAAGTGVRGADAVYVALAQELGATLVTVDRQQLTRASVVARVARP